MLSINGSIPNLVVVATASSPRTKIYTSPAEDERSQSAYCEIGSADLRNKKINSISKSSLLSDWNVRWPRQMLSPGKQVTVSMPTGQAYGQTDGRMNTRPLHFAFSL